MEDYGYDPKLRNHSGYHPATQLKMANDMTGNSYYKVASALEEFLSPDSEESEDMVMLFVCRKERHRSVGGRALLWDYVQREGHKVDAHRSTVL